MKRSTRRSRFGPVVPAGRPPEGGSSSLVHPVHLVLGGLRERADHQPVDVDVVRAGGAERHAVGDVVGDQRLGDARVHGCRLVGVATEAHERELVGAHHARGDVDDPHRLAVEFEPERVDKGLLGVLGGRVPAAAFVGDEARGGADHHDRPRSGRLEHRQQRLGDPHAPQHVDLVHLPPLVQVGPLDGVGSERAAGVVHQQRQVAGQAVHRGCERGHVGIGRDVAAHRHRTVSAASAASRSSRRAAATTLKPSAASRRAVAAPIPLDAPVTTAMRSAMARSCQDGPARRSRDSVIPRP